MTDGLGTSPRLKRLQGLYSTDQVCQLYTVLVTDPLEYESRLMALQHELGKHGFNTRSYDRIVRREGPLRIVPRDGPPTQRVQDLGDLLREPAGSYTWVVEQLLYSGGLSILSADPKAGKSSIARWLLSCVVGGAPFMGRATTMGPVLYLSLEDPKLLVHHDLSRFSKGLALADQDFRGSEVVYTLPENQDPLVYLRERVAAVQPHLVVIDTLMRFMQLDTGDDYAQVTSHMGRLRDYVKEDPWMSHHCHLMLLHHNNKGASNSQAADPFKAQMGSAGFRGATDVNIHVYKNQRQPAEHFIAEPEGKVLRSTPHCQIRDRHGRLEFIATARKEEADNRAAAEVLALLDDGLPKSHREIYHALKGDALPISRDSLRKLLEGLVNKGLVHKLGSARRIQYQIDLPSQSGYVPDPEPTEATS